MRSGVLVDDGAEHREVGVAKGSVGKHQMIVLWGLHPFVDGLRVPADAAFLVIYFAADDVYQARPIASRFFSTDPDLSDSRNFLVLPREFWERAD